MNDAVRAALPPDAAPALKPAVEVWREAKSEAEKGGEWSRAGIGLEWGDDDAAAAAVIEADRAAIIAVKDAEIAALKNTWQKQFDEKVRERGEAKLWFEKAQEWKQSLAALQAHADALAGYVKHKKSCDYYEEKQGGSWVQVGCTCGLSAVLRAYEEFRRG